MFIVTKREILHPRWVLNIQQVMALYGYKKIVQWINNVMKVALNSCNETMNIHDLCHEFSWALSWMTHDHETFWCHVRHIQIILRNIIFIQGYHKNDNSCYKNNFPDICGSWRKGRLMWFLIGCCHGSSWGIRRTWFVGWMREIIWQDKLDLCDTRPYVFGIYVRDVVKQIDKPSLLFGWW